jgi:hypothetical protein
VAEPEPGGDEEGGGEDAEVRQQVGELAVEAARVSGSESGTRTSRANSVIAIAKIPSASVVSRWGEWSRPSIAST